MSGPALLRGGILVGATLLLLVALQDIEWDRLLQLLRTLRLPWLAAAIGLNGSIIVLWSLQWKILVPGEGSVTWANMFPVVSAMAMISNSVPFMVGQASGVLLLARYGGIGHASALSVYTMEQVAEGIAKLVVVVGLALFAPLPELLARGVQVLAVVVSVLGVTFVVLAFRFRHPPPPCRRRAPSAESNTLEPGGPTLSKGFVPPACLPPESLSHWA